MLPPRLCLVLVATAAIALPSACITTDATNSSVTVRTTQGVVMQATLDDVWRAVQAVLPGAPSAGAPMSAKSAVRGAAVEVRVERYNDARTILHVTSPDPAVAEDVQLRIQRMLLNGS